MALDLAKVEEARKASQPGDRIGVVVATSPEPERVFPRSNGAREFNLFVSFGTENAANNTGLVQSRFVVPL